MKVVFKDKNTKTWKDVYVDKNTSLIPNSEWIAKELLYNGYDIPKEFDIKHFFEDDMLKLELILNDEVIGIFLPFWGVSNGILNDNEWKKWRKLERSNPDKIK